MKTIAIGDTHGRNIWQDIVNKELGSSDKIIFLGDYFDTHDNISAIEQIHNFKEILEVKRNYPNKIVLLIGNHDYHYLKGISEHYSGYQNFKTLDIQVILHEALDENLLQMCYIEGNYIFTHAGLSKTWCQKNLGVNTFTDNIVLQQAVNDLFKYQPNSFRFTSGKNYSSTGNDITQSPIWIRPESLGQDKLDGYEFVVGHTQVPRLMLNQTGIFKNIIQIDCLGYAKEYLIINNNEETIGIV